jgi:hypothetical protein
MRAAEEIDCVLKTISQDEVLSLYSEMALPNKIQQVGNSILQAEANAIQARKAATLPASEVGTPVAKTTVLSSVAAFYIYLYGNWNSSSTDIKIVGFVMLSLYSLFSFIELAYHIYKGKQKEADHQIRSIELKKQIVQTLASTSKAYTVFLHSNDLKTLKRQKENLRSYYMTSLDGHVPVKLSIIFGHVESLIDKLPEELIVSDRHLIPLRELITNKGIPAVDIILNEPNSYKSDPQIAAASFGSGEMPTVVAGTDTDNTAIQIADPKFAEA